MRDEGATRETTDRILDAQAEEARREWPVCDVLDCPGHGTAHPPLEPAHREPDPAPRYVRDWRPGDPRVVQGRSLWLDADHDGSGRQEVWLSPAEVRAAGLTESMRQAIHDGAFAEAVSQDLEAARSRDVRPASSSDGGAVSADEYFADGAVSDELVRGEPHEDDRQTVEEALAYEPEPLDRDRLRATAMGEQGEIDGWRWWVVRDQGGDWLAYDNRPALDAWDADGGFLPPGAPRPRRGPRPRLVQGRLPLAVLVKAVAASCEPDEARRPFVGAYPDWDRASGATVCEAVIPAVGGMGRCGREYRAHPPTDFDGLVLHRLCDGRWVKL